MRVVECHARIHSERRAKAARRSSRCMPKASARKFHPKQNASIQKSPPGRAGPVSPGVKYRRRACADCFRSQLRRLGFGPPHQARPRRGYANITWGSRADPQNRNFLLGWKAELSIWLRHRNVVFSCWQVGAARQHQHAEIPKHIFMGPSASPERALLGTERR
jgi:hypothetical protein